MDTITILGISLLFFYSLTTILQFYGIDTSVYSIYILFYIFIIVSRLILPMNYAKLFPETEAPLTNDVASGPLTTDVASGALANDTDASSSPIANDNDASSSPTIVFPPRRPQGEITNIDRVPVAPSQGQVTNINRGPVAPAPSLSPPPNTTSNATPPKKPKNNAPSGSGYLDFSGLGPILSGLGAFA